MKRQVFFSLMIVLLSSANLLSQSRQLFYIKLGEKIRIDYTTDKTYIETITFERKSVVHVRYILSGGLLQKTLKFRVQVKRKPQNIVSYKISDFCTGTVDLDPSFDDTTRIFSIIYHKVIITEKQRLGEKIQYGNYN